MNLLVKLREEQLKAALLYHREAREKYEAQKAGYQYDTLVRWFIAGIRAERQFVVSNLGGLISY